MTTAPQENRPAAIAMVAASAFLSKAAGSVHNAKKIITEPTRMMLVLIFDEDMVSKNYVLDLQTAVRAFVLNRK